MSKLFVANMPFSITETDLTALFADYGTVEKVKIVNDHETGVSKGFGFVEMPLEEEAQRALDTLNGYGIGGRRIFVAIAKDAVQR